MEKEKVKRIIQAFVQTVRRIDPKWRLPGGELPAKYIEEGIGRLEKVFPMGMADQRIADFIMYQVYRYADNINGTHATHFMYSWCWSDNAVKKFQNQYFGAGNPRIDYWIDKWADDLGFNREQLSELISGPKPNKWRRYLEMPSEEMTKRRFRNTEMGLILCSNSTMGWSPGSRACQECKYIKECKITTKRKYPELLRLREENGNDKEESTNG